MKKAGIGHYLWTILAIVSLGCTSGGGSDQVARGSVEVNIRPFSLAADIEQVMLTVSGDGISTDIVVEIPEGPEDEWSLLLPNIPAGTERVFTAEAYDVSGELIYIGGATGVIIVDGETTMVDIYLQELDPPVPFENAVPVITSFLMAPMSVFPGETVQLGVTASDANPEDTLSFSWSTDGGSFSVLDLPNTEWTAPTISGTYTVSVSVSDPAGSTAALSAQITVIESGSALVNIIINHSPEVDSLVPTPTRIDAGEAISFNLTVDDIDGDDMTYEWLADCDGIFTDSTAEDAVFTLNDVTGDTCTLSVRIEDGRGGSNQASITIETGLGTVPQEVPPGCTGVIDFPSSRMEKEIRLMLQMPEGDIRFGDLNTVEILFVNSGETDRSNITGIQCLTNLTSLFLVNLDITDAALLAGLTNLTNIDLTSNFISDISPFAGLTNLTVLSLFMNNVVDLSPLEGLTQLLALDLSWNYMGDISDISPLAGLTNLTQLSLWGNNITDISPLEGLEALNQLDVSDNDIADISPLVANPGIGSGDIVDIDGNPLDCTDPAVLSDIATLVTRGVDLRHPCD